MSPFSKSRRCLGWGAAGFALAVAVAPCRAQDVIAITPSNAASVREIAVLSGHRAPVFSLAFSPDGGRVASASIDKTVRVWDVAAKKEVASFAGHTKQVVAVAFAADGYTVYSAGYDHAIRWFGAATGKPAGSLTESVKKEPVAFETLNAAFAPAGTRFADTGLGGAQLDLWDVPARSLREVSGGTAGELFGRTAFSGDGAHLAVQRQLGEQGSAVEVYAVADATREARIAAPEKTLLVEEGVALDAAGTTLAVVDKHSSRILVFDVKSGKAGAVLAGHAHDADSEQLLIAGLAFTPDGKVLVSGSYDKTARLWDVASGKELVSLPHKKEVAAVAVSPDGARIATAEMDGTVHVYGLPIR